MESIPVTVKQKKLYGFYIPKDYTQTSDDDLIETDIYDSADEINKQYDIIDVVDDGIGIASNEIEKITDKFYRVDTTS